MATTAESREQSGTVAPALAPDVLARLRRDPAGLVAAIVQQHDTGEVLMLAWMDEEALRRTRESGEAWFWSRSRAELWHKGETSGATLAVVELRDDCDGDANRNDHSNHRQRRPPALRAEAPEFGGDRLLRRAAR